jgi:hypothetical protein
LEKFKSEGFTVADLKGEGGFTLLEFVLNISSGNSFTLQELFKGGFTIPELKLYGIQLEGFKRDGFEIYHLKDHFDLREFKTARFTPFELLNGGISYPNLKKAGYTIDDFKDSENTNKINNLYNLYDLFNQKFINAEEFLSAKIVLTELKRHNISITILRTAGFSFSDIFKAGFSFSDIFKAGYTYGEISPIYKEIHEKDKDVAFEKMVNECETEWKGMKLHRNKNCTYASIQHKIK